MHFFVEVTPIGQSETQTYCVEAESWQKALQAARTTRGDQGPISGFSIELTDAGCRAVDPMARLRYMVKQAPDNAPLTAGAVRPVAPRAVPAKTTSGGVAPPANPPASESMAASKKPGSRTIVYGSSGAVAIREPAKDRLKELAGIHVTGGAAKISEEVTTAQSPPAPVDSSSAAAEHMQATRVIYRRDQEPSIASPLTYREEMLAVAPGTSEDEAATMLRAHLAIVQRSLDGARPGKYVNLAVFDQIFQGKPPVLPLAVLSWKDWQGEPVGSFPRRPKAPLPVTQASAHLAPAAAVALSGKLPAAGKMTMVGHPPPQPAKAPEQPPGIAALGAAIANAGSAPPGALASVPIPLVPRNPVPVIAPVSVGIAVAPAVASPAKSAPGAEPARPRQSLRPSAPGMPRVGGDELVAILFEEMHDLHFLSDAVEGGQFCLALALEKLPSRAGLMHLYDINRREFVIASANGKGTEHLLSRRHGEGDPLISAAMRKRSSVVMNNAESHDAAFVKRYETLGGAKSLIISPVMKGGRFLGAIELINPLDGAPFTEADGNALAYMSEQYAEFLASRGVILDPERIASAAKALRR